MVGADEAERDATLPPPLPDKRSSTCAAENASKSDERLVLGRDAKGPTCKSHQWGKRGSCGYRGGRQAGWGASQGVQCSDQMPWPKMQQKRRSGSRESRRTHITRDSLAGWLQMRQQHVIVGQCPLELAVGCVLRDAGLGGGGVTHFDL